MKNKAPKLIRIRPTILTLLLLLCSIIIITLLTLQYYFSHQLAFKAIDENFQHISQRLDNKIKNLDHKNNSIISMLEFYNNINEKPEINKKHPLLPFFTNVLKNNKYIYSLYIGHQNGDFYEIINLNISDKLRKKYKVTNKAQWLVIKILKEDKQNIQYEEFLDKSFSLITRRKSIATYNPINRPWYKDAINSHTIIKTKPYMFSNLEAIGITYAKEFKNTKSVIGIDISLDSLDQFLKSQLRNKKEQIILFKEDGTITTSVTLDPKDNTQNIEYKKILDFTFSDNRILKHTVLNLNNEEYFVYVSKVKSVYSKKDYLAIIVPVQEIMQPYTDKILYSFFITFLVVLLLIPIILYASKLFLKPITLLEEENNKIQNRDFSHVKRIHTRLKEIHDLSESFVAMSSSIQEYQNAQKELMDSFIKLIASAIDAKSKYTGGHCERVPVLTMMIAQEASKNSSGIFKDFVLKDEEERRELNIAAWLHDCGKVTTPEYVVDKATKLETNYNRIHEIRTRFEVLHRDLTITSLNNIINGENQEAENIKLRKQQEILFKEFEIIAKANIGSEFMTKEDIKEIETIAQRSWNRYFDNSLGTSKDEVSRANKDANETLPKKEYLLADKKDHIIPREHFSQEEYERHNFKQEVPKDLYNLGEIYNLCIQKGTLTAEERYKINEHVIMSIVMLEELPFPDNLKRVSEYAGAHHETLVGTGYPRKLTKEQMSIPARIIAIADIFEALTASDRPYKDAKTLNEAIKILSFMVKDKHIDEDIFQLFLKSGIFNEYAKKYLKEEQINEVNISDFIK